jgi:3-hydroxybutyryl-CoA dehydrogenase
MLNFGRSAGAPGRAGRRRGPVEIEKVGVVGCGLMGSGIAEAAARAGLDVHVVDLDGAALERGRERISTSIARAQKAGKLSDADGEAALARIEFSTDIGSLADRQSSPRTHRPSRS